MFQPHFSIQNLSYSEIRYKFGVRALKIEHIRNTFKNDNVIKVPSALYLPISVSKQLNRQMQGIALRPFNEIPSKDIFSPNVEEVKRFLERNEMKMRSLVAPVLDQKERQILRSFSSIENLANYKDISFAGYCRSKIPPDFSESEEDLLKRLASVFVGCSSRYAKYYQHIHRLPLSSKDVGICSMDYVPGYYANGTVYITNDFFGLMLNSVDGSFTNVDVVIRLSGNHKKNLYAVDSKIQDLQSRAIAKKVMVELIRVKETLKLGNAGSDFEFVVKDTSGSDKIYIVQERNLSKVHRVNYEVAAKTSTLNSGWSSSHILHTCQTIAKSYFLVDSQSLSSNENFFLKNDSSLLFLVDHESGQASLDFLGKLPKEVRCGLVLCHSHGSRYDHFRYSIYEDPRIISVYNLESKNKVELLKLVNNYCEVYSSGDVFSLV